MIRNRPPEGGIPNQEQKRRFALPAHSKSFFLYIFVGLVLVYGIIYPTAHVFIAALQHDGGWSPSNFFAVLSQRTVLESAVTSITVSVLTVLLCALAGVPLAFLFERYAFPGRRLFAALAALPLVLPPLVGTVAFIFLCGESGILARTVQHAFHLTKAPWSLRGWGALLLFHTYTMYPFFYVLAGAGLQRVDAGLAEAARSLGASRLRVLIRVTLPQLTPSLIAAALLTFMTSMASFSAPLLFGGNVRMLTLEIFSARQRGDTSVALTETVLLALISLVALLFFQRYEGTRRFVAAAMKGTTRRRQPLKSGKARLLAASAAIVFSLILALPIATLVLVSFSRDGSWTTQTLPPVYTVANFARITTDVESRSVFINSLLMAGMATLAALIWSFCVTALTASGKPSRWARLINVLVLLPWALPGTVVAVSVAEAYGQPNVLTGSFILIGTFWILPVVYFLRFMPLVVRAVQASIEQLDRALEEAAAVLGASWWRRFWRVRLPLVAPGALAGALLVFVIAMGEYVASVIVFTPGNRPVSIAIASAMRDFNLGTAAAYGVILIAMIVIVMVVAGRLESRAQ
ncbi:MAG: iron(III) transport system permease protein [Blastocatellia bacterium]|jgi:iron(III) transport system permease protein|nr:iron(III) transport system permease protein [Blastocatellia bacterium]